MQDGPRLGQLVKNSDAKRDAIHVAVVPISSAYKLTPGQRVNVVGGRVVPSDRMDSTGIVDPFLAGAIQPGYTFWLLMTPGTVTSLRHDWEHDSFNPEEETEPVFVEDEDEDTRQCREMGCDP
jgi:hypothetical protein